MAKADNGQRMSRNRDTRLPLRPDTCKLLSKRAVCHLQVRRLLFALRQPNVCTARPAKRWILTLSLQHSRRLFAVGLQHLRGFAFSAPFRVMACDRVVTSRLGVFGSWRELDGKIKDAPSVGVQAVGIARKYAPANCQAGWHHQSKMAKFSHFQRRRLL